MTTRREFIAASAALIAAPVLAKPAPAVLYCDGVNPDSDGLDAWMSDQPVVMADGSAVPEYAFIGRTFLLTRILDLSKSKPVMFAKDTFIFNLEGAKP